jgi:Family of unknown function (DUF6444)
VPDAPGVPSAEELSALPHAELAARLAEAYRLIAELTSRMEELERRAGRDSSTSSRPPSSDSPSVIGTLACRVPYRLCAAARWAGDADDCHRWSGSERLSTGPEFRDEE